MTEEQIQKLVDYTAMDATCPLCHRTETCDPECHYHADCRWADNLAPYHRMVRARFALRKEQ